MDEYDAIARRFFNQFIELVLASGGTAPPNYDKELAQYKKAAAQFKKAAQDMAEDNSKLQDALASMEEELERERGLKNEVLIAYQALKEKVEGVGVKRREARETGYSFLEHLGPDSRRAWVQLMAEIPYRGTKGHEQ